MKTLLSLTSHRTWMNWVRVFFQKIDGTSVLDWEQPWGKALRNQNSSSGLITLIARRALTSLVLATALHSTWATAQTEENTRDSSMQVATATQTTILSGIQPTPEKIIKGWISLETNLSKYLDSENLSDIISAHLALGIIWMQNWYENTDESQRKYVDTIWDFMKGKEVQPSTKILLGIFGELREWTKKRLTDGRRGVVTSTEIANIVSGYPYIDVPGKPDIWDFLSKAWLKDPSSIRDLSELYSTAEMGLKIKWDLQILQNTIRDNGIKFAEMEVKFAEIKIKLAEINEAVKWMWEIARFLEVYNKFNRSANADNTERSWVRDICKNALATVNYRPENIIIRWILSEYLTRLETGTVKPKIQGPSLLAILEWAGNTVSLVKDSMAKIPEIG